MLRCASLVIFVCLFLQGMGSRSEAGNLAGPAETILLAHGLGETLVPIGPKPSRAETAALIEAIARYQDAGDCEAVAPLQAFLDAHPHSGWKTALLADLGVIYRATGYFSRALAAWEEAWTLLRTTHSPESRALWDLVASELVELHGRLGHRERMRNLLAEVEGKRVRGSAAEKLSRARRGLWTMDNQPEVAYRYGPLGLASLLEAGNGGDPGDKLGHALSTHDGTSLWQNLQWSRELHLGLQAARRSPDAGMPVPALVHWKAGHYAALVLQREDRYLVKDPTFGPESWISRAALEAEATGYALIPSGPLPRGWRAVEEAEARTVTGTWTETAGPNRGTFSFTVAQDKSILKGVWETEGYQEKHALDAYRSRQVLVKVTPESAILDPGETLAFGAQVAGTLDKRVAWSSSSPGNMTEAGLFTAPEQMGTCTVTASSVDSPAAKATASVQVTLKVQVEPKSITLGSGQKVTFRAYTSHVPALPVTWSIPAGPTGGGITQAGEYTAPATGLGVFQVQARSIQDGRLVGTATVTVPGSVPIRISMAPSEVVLAKGTKQSFAAVVSGAANSAVHWSCSGGAIDSSGLYTAPERFGTYTVTTTSAADPSVKDEATVVVAGGTGWGAFTYDLNGNLTDDGDRSFEWDAENRLTAVTITATGHRSEFGYDGMGRRVCIRELDPDQTQNLQVTSDKKYLWDGAEIAEERSTDGGTVLKRFFANGFVDSDGIALFYTKDHLQSVRELTDGTQAVRARYDYDPYGRMTKLQGDRDSSFGFGHYMIHSYPGLLLTRFRAYDPNLGRWLSRDPIDNTTNGLVPAGFGGLSQFFDNPLADFPEVYLGPNLYSYVNNSPTVYDDYFGLCPSPCHTPPGYQAGPQDDVCTIGVSPRWVPYRFTKCCAEHDHCYEQNGCNAKSWLPGCGTPACKSCNNTVIRCLLIWGYAGPLF
ncbi:MAG: RHS repeat-associated core domain-containing protein [Holophaga sp.]